MLLNQLLSETRTSLLHTRLIPRSREASDRDGNSLLAYCERASVLRLAEGRDGHQDSQTKRFRSNIAIVTFPIAGTYIEALSLTSFWKFCAMKMISSRASVI